MKLLITAILLCLIAVLAQGQIEIFHDNEDVVQDNEREVRSDNVNLSDEHIADEADLDERSLEDFENLEEEERQARSPNEELDDEIENEDVEADESEIEKRDSMKDLRKQYREAKKELELCKRGLAKTSEDCGACFRSCKGKSKSCRRGCKDTCKAFRELVEKECNFDEMKDLWKKMWEERQKMGLGPPRNKGPWGRRRGGGWKNGMTVK